MILNLESFRTTGGNDEPSTGKEAAKLYILMLIEELLDGWREWWSWYAIAKQKQSSGHERMQRATKRMSISTDRE